MKIRLLLILIVLLAVGVSVSAQSIRAAAVNVIYGSTRSHRLDVYLPEGFEAPYPVIVMFHGAPGDKGDIRNYGIPQLVVPEGYAAVLITYTTQLPQAFADGFCAVAWVLANATDYGFDTEKIALFGLSYGGLVVTYVGAHDEPSTYQEGCPQTIPDSFELAGVISDAGVMTLRQDVLDTISADLPDQAAFVETLDNTPTSEWRTLNAPPEVQSYLDYASPYWLDGSEAPHLLIHGIADTIVPYQTSVDYAAELLAVNVNVMTVFDRLSGHVPAPRVFDQEMMAFLHRIFD